MADRNMDWRTPLADSLLEELKSSANHGDRIDFLERVEKSAVMLQGAPDYEKVMESIRSQREELTGLYDEYASQMSVELSDSKLNEIKTYFSRIPGYREAGELAARCDELLQEKERLEEAKKKKARKTSAIILSGVAACIVIAIVILVTQNQARYRRAIDGISASIEAGKYPEAEEALKSIELKQGEEEDALVFTLYRNYFEAMRSEDGLEAAQTLLSDAKADGLLSGTNVERIYHEDYNDLHGRLQAGTLDLGGILDMCDIALNHKVLDGTTPSALYEEVMPGLEALGASGDCYRELFEKAESSEHPVRLSVNSAISITKKLAEAGEDLNAVFPNGIRVDMDLTAHVRKLRRLASATDTDTVEQHEATFGSVIPVHILQSPKASNGKEIWEIVESSSSSLEAEANVEMENPDNYGVYFRPVEYMKLDESMRAESLETCETMIAATNAYVLCGNVIWHNRLTRGTYTTETTDYYGYFAALETVMALNPKDTEALTILSYEGYMPPIADKDEKWLNDTLTPLWHNAGQMLGKSDPEALLTQLTDAVENYQVYQMLYQIMNNAEKEVTSDEAD